MDQGSHTLVFTDLVDSTQLTERLGDERARALFAAHDRAARALLAPCGGREVDRTDGFFLLFDDVAGACRFALGYHRALADLDLASRVGIHVGNVSLFENAPEDVARGAKPTEVEGLAKAFTARVMALARGGQTLLSAAARASLGDDAVPPDALVDSHGHYRLKGVEAPVEIFELGLRDTSHFLPPDDVEKAYRVVRAGDFWRPVREVRHNLPAERDAFVGRSAELRTLAARFDGGARLVTVLGPGGTGKTRLVRRYGWTWLGDWPGGVHFCDLSEARSLDGIYFAVAQALEVPLRRDPAAQLGNAIAGRGRCLIVLDNFEQVVAHAPATLGPWLDRARDAAFLVTSRERMHLAGEEILPLEPLPLAEEAIELFATRARAQRPDFALDDSNRVAVGEVVRLLDGLPLAIELAAARTRVLSPAQLVERMRDRFTLLAGARGAAARQATLRAAIDWSWELLEPWEQAAFAQCSTFDGGFMLEAAEAVLNLKAWREAPPVLDVVQALADKSLLRIYVPAGQRRYAFDEPYFGMYLSIHEYAAEKLAGSGGDAVATEARHGGYFAGFGTADAIAALSEHGGVRRRHVLALELDNLLTACRRAIARRDSVQALYTFRAAWEVLELQGPAALAATLCVQVLALDGLDAAQRADMLMTHALALRRTQRGKDIGPEPEQALAMARQLGDRRLEASILVNLGNLQREHGRMGEARASYESSLALYRQLGRLRNQGTVLGNLGTLHIEQGHADEADTHYAQALAIHRETGNRRSEGIILGNMGGLRFTQGRVDEAEQCSVDALAIHREVGNRIFEGMTLGNLGGIQLSRGQLDQARANFEDALALARELGDRRSEGDVLDNLGLLLRAQRNFDQARAHHEAALVIHREVGNRRHEGMSLGNLGGLRAELGHVAAGRADVDAAESILREVGDEALLAQVLCERGRVEVAAGNRAEAQAALESASKLMQSTDAAPESEVGRAVARLRHALADPPDRVPP